MEKMEKEFLGLLKSARKAAFVASLQLTSKYNSFEVTRCVDILQQLRSFPVTNELLTKTNASGLLREEIVYHRHNRIQSMALSVLEAWKKAPLISCVPPETKKDCSGKRISFIIGTTEYSQWRFLSRRLGKKDCSLFKVRDNVSKTSKKINPFPSGKK
ncbi:hypothetical protein ACFE04_003206 [Oxalis oulophora]